MKYGASGSTQVWLCTYRRGAALIADGLWNGRDVNRRRIRTVGILLLAVGGVLWLALGWLTPTPPENGPAGNSVSPPRFEEFVGKQTCAECHAAEAERHGTSGHSRTFHLTGDFAPAGRLAGQTFTDPVRKGSFRYEDGPPEGLRVFIPGQFNNDAFPLKYILGSNTHAATFLTLLPMPDGQTGGIEHRVSLYGDELGLTPGQRDALPREEVEAFGASQDPPTTQACVGCHTTHFDIVEHDLRNLIANVECESCHGPGRDHVNSKRRDRPEHLIRSLAATDRRTSLDQIRNCGRCHRLPEDLSPEKLFPENWKLVRYQSVGMLMSDCFTKSQGAFGCTTCHDPHESSSTHAAASQRACLKCHSANSTDIATCPVTKTDNCLDCHMPKVEIHKGILFRDHWVRVHRPGDEARADREDAGHSPAPEHRRQND